MFLILCSLMLVERRIFCSGWLLEGRDEPVCPIDLFFSLNEEESGKREPRKWLL